jgi:hypothetical protein
MNESLKIVGASVLGLAAGAAVGFKIAEKRLAAEFEERLAQETAEMRVFYSSVKQKYDTPQEAVKDLMPEKPEEPVVEDPREKAQKVAYHKIVQAAEYVAMADEAEEGAAVAAEEIRHNVFVTKPDPDKPYVISQEEFMANESGHNQVTLTYYEKGGVLTDERDDILDDPTNMVGEWFASSFGEGSSDENVVHVRNDKIGIEFEICKSERSYEEDVLGESENGVESPQDRLRREG